VLDFHTYAHRIEWITGAVYDRWPEAIHRPATRRTSVVLTSPVEVAAPALGLVATSLIESGIAERSRAPIVEALRNEPSATGILTRLAAEEARARGDRAQALALLRRALDEGEATRSQTQFAAGQLALEIEGPAAALPHLRRAVALCPTEPVYHAAVGVAYLALSDWARARAALEEALALVPELELARTWWDRFREQLEAARPVTDLPA
jgi:tetratricopeptide (TPR) repeat protein